MNGMVVYVCMYMVVCVCVCVYVIIDLLGDGGHTS